MQALTATPRTHPSHNLGAIRLHQRGIHETQGGSNTLYQYFAMGCEVHENNQPIIKESGDVNEAVGADQGRHQSYLLQDDEFAVVLLQPE